MNLRSLLLPVLCGFLIGAAPFLIINGITLTGFGAWSIVGIEIFYLAVPVFAVVGIFALLACIIPQSRAAAVIIAVSSLSLSIGAVTGAFLGWKVRDVALSQAVERAQPLVDAIVLYQEDNGKPPKKFEDIIPKYLKNMPRRIPPMRLISGADARTSYDGNSWVLVAYVPGGWMNWDELIYLPNQNYEGYKAYKQLGSWAYYYD